MKEISLRLSEILQITGELTNSDWISQLYSLVGNFIDSLDSNFPEDYVESSSIEKDRKLKDNVFYIVLDIVSKHKPRYVEFKFDKHQKSIRALKPQIILKTEIIKSLIEEVVTPYKESVEKLNSMNSILMKRDEEIKKLEVYNDEMNRTVETLHDKIKLVRNRSLQKDRFKFCPTRMVLYDLANDCRMKNGKISHSKLGKKLGRTHVTAKRWCQLMDVK